MAKIDRAEYSESTISDQPSRAKMDPNVAATGGRMFFELGEGLGQVADQLEKAHSLAETTRSDNALQAKSYDILARSQQDPDTSQEKANKYHQELDKAIEESAKTITTPGARERFIAQAQGKAEIDKLKINGFFRDRVIDQSKADLAIKQNNLGHQYITANTIGEKEMAIQELNLQYAKMVSAGYISKDDAAKSLLEIQKKWDEGHVKYDAEVRSEFAVEELSKPDGGFYKDIPAEIRAKALEDAQKHVIRKNAIADRQQKAAMKANDYQMLNKWIGGNLSISDIEQATDPANPKMSLGLAKALASNLKSKKAVEAKNDFQTVSDLQMMMANPENTDPAELMSKIVQANSDGKIDEKKAEQLFNAKLIPTKEGPMSLFQAMAKEKMDEVAARRSPLIQAIRFIKKSLGSDAAGHSAVIDALMNSLENVTNTGIAAKALELVKGYRLQQLPEMASYPESGQRLIDANGNVAIGMNDGGVQPGTEDEPEKVAEDAGATDESY